MNSCCFFFSYSKETSLYQIRRKIWFLPKSENDKLDSFLELRTYKVKIYQDSVRNRHYYQLTCGILKSEIGELGF